MKKNLLKKTNEKDFFQLKKEIENDKKEIDNTWRVALGDFSLKFRKEKEKEKLFFLEFLAENYTSRLDVSFDGGGDGVGVEGGVGGGVGVGGNIITMGSGCERVDYLLNSLRVEIQVRY